MFGIEKYWSKGKGLSKEYPLSDKKVNLEVKNTLKEENRESKPSSEKEQQEPQKIEGFSLN